LVDLFGRGQVTTRRERHGGADGKVTTKSTEITKNGREDLKNGAKVIEVR
jgi:hypothetical protein